MRSLRQKLTPAMATIMGLLSAASLLAAIQLFLVELPVAAVAVLLVGGAALLLAWKVHTTSLMTRELKRRLAVLSHGAQPMPTVAAVVAPADPLVTAPADQADAPAPPDPPAHRSSTTLFAALGGDGSQPAGRTIAMVGSDALTSRLAAHGSVQRLHPLLSAEQVRSSRPTALVVEEDAIDPGPWGGALAPHGAALLAELREAIAWVLANGDFVYVIPANGARQPSASALRANTIVLDVQTLAEHAHDAPPSILSALASHRAAASL